jgi:hypothetical protein
MFEYLKREDEDYNNIGVLIAVQLGVDVYGCNGDLSDAGIKEGIHHSLRSWSGGSGPFTLEQVVEIILGVWMHKDRFSPLNTPRNRYDLELETEKREWAKPEMRKRLRVIVRDDPGP